jgi:tetratricopeptide (TPR) repeat protein
LQLKKISVKGKGFVMKVCIILVALPFLLSCLWDKDTIKDEFHSKSGLYHLIIGQLPTHSEDYYRKRLDDQIKILAESKGSVGFNTIATAHIRLGEFPEAEAALRYCQKKFPKDYFTLSNLGVMYKKKGEYGKAIILINEALKLKPAGHMGLGDWYLRMLVFKLQSAEKEQENNFLGKPYLTKYIPGPTTVKNAAHTRLMFTRLIKNDQHFADGFLSLADFLVKTGDLNLALRAYMRADLLGHSKKEQIHKMIKDVFGHLYSGLRDKEKAAEVLEKTKLGILAEFKKAEAWNEAFRQMEAQLLKEFKNVDFKMTYKALKAKGVLPYRP